MQTHDFERQYGSPDPSDQRSPAQRDRDRVLYAEEFRRLAGVTQVLSGAGHAFHNRLTHTLETAQISRRMAERLRERALALGQPERAAQIDPDVVETAALIHDLGHPIFGHLGEHELDVLARAAGDPDGFEGNAQSFRIVTRLAMQSGAYPGLNLTRRTLRASLKYPNLRAPAPVGGQPPSKAHLKFGAYRDDAASFHFAREGAEHLGPSLEAQLMDYADDIAYSMSDLMDFYKAGMLPLADLGDPQAFEAFFTQHRDEIVCGLVLADEQQTRAQLRQTLATFDPTPGFDGSRADVLNLRARISGCIGRFLQVSVDWDDPCGPQLVVPEATRLEINLFKRIIWEYVISHQSIHTQREAHTQVVRTVFGAVLQAVQHGPDGVKDAQLRAFLPPWHLDGTHASHPVRLALDIVAGMSEAQAEAFATRLTTG
ncbi:deoxyguanosinetriphosphate triphosphohydrolase family protein [Deinococcus multiflagellatus]|uniref:Deoxyguanosinetriphosphate triphosphohydrolase family protein n=1 Tax=Deinococcus multiflagellatus TaxID=1656887 RepID=A0ABW1ZRP0_9DEIO|nr:dNTP triphosphohydrolase [Deinococcus multiflagellatus]MBZ9714978.1 dNTP triphosphohydrolase [Deinococcus multiflagellatus]